MRSSFPLIFEISRKGRSGVSLPMSDVPETNIELPDKYKRVSDIDLPEVSEIDAVRHFTGLSQRNHGVDSGFYPLGSCTMKYNPKIDEEIAKLPGFTDVHPYQSEKTVQGCLEIMYDMCHFLTEVTGMDSATLQPSAGAHGEFTGLLIIRAYHRSRGDFKRTKIIVPDSAHGTNPASAAMAGFKVVQVKSNENGGVDIDELKKIVNDETAGLMLTNPNTLGVFDSNILKIADIVHDAGGLLYYDGANINAVMGMARPADMGFDVVHLNLHKTFATPHGGGGPGNGAVCVRKELGRFLPVPVVQKKENIYSLDYDRPDSIGKIKSFYGSLGVIVKAYAYILSVGGNGLKEVSRNAVLNSNYILSRLIKYYDIPYNKSCMHEFVISAMKQKEEGVSALDIAKRLMDFGIHPPTIYFPLIVKEALMIEPTETESKETLDRFIEIMIKISEDGEKDPEIINKSPLNTVIDRPDDVLAARKPVVRYKKGNS